MEGVYSQRKDLTGLRFGKLTVIGLTSERRDKRPVWNLLCDCGREHKATSKSLQRGKASCGCSRIKTDLSGARFGKLTVLRYSGAGRKNGYSIGATWECVCECGNVHIDTAKRLIDGMAVSCGCHARPRKINKDLAGRRFGMLTVVAPLEKRSKHSNIIWRCLCDCGSTIDVIGSYLTQRAECRTTSCRRCASKAKSERHSLKLEGRKFGRLTVVRRTGRKRNNHNEWECLCECGKTHNVSSSGLTGGTRSCGCLASETASASNIRRFKQDHKSGAVWLYDNGVRQIKMRSSWEVVFARWLDDNNEPWEYEPKIFILGKAVRYTPDFFLPARGVHVEVKGFMSDFAKKKIDAFRSTHLLVLVGKTFIAKITGHDKARDIARLVRRVAPIGPACRKQPTRRPLIPEGQMRLF